MKEKIKKSFNHIKLTDSQKDNMYKNILLKKNNQGITYFKYASILSFILVITILSFPLNENEEEMLVRTIANDQLFLDDKCYSLVYINYELGSLMNEIYQDEISYKIYENLLDSNTYVIYNDVYEVYVECEE